jgi:hypothetical protein
MKMIKERFTRMFLHSSFKNFLQLGAATSLVERIVNSRPLTFVSNEEHHGFALTPSMFLNVAAEDLDPEPLAVQLDPEMVLPLETKKIQAYVTARRTFARNLWAQFYDGYVDLLKRNAANTTKETRRLRQGQVVLFKRHDLFKTDSSLTRKEWHLARIHKIYDGTDGLPRVVDIEVPKENEYGTKVLRRQSVKFIVPLEADLYADQNQQKKNRMRKV